MNLIEFTNYLRSLKYSESTIHSYLSDVQNYLNSQLNLQSYLQSISPDPNYKRYHSSLSIYSRFLQHGDTSIPDQISQYKKYLEKKNTPISTIRNYINDVNQYISWLNSLEN